MAMTGILEQETHSSDSAQSPPTEQQWRHGLTGNLCRCTGYAPIVEAGHKASVSQTLSMNERYPPAEMIDAAKAVADQVIQIQSDAESSTVNAVYCPTTLDEAVRFISENPDAKIVAGATDLGVQFNKGFCQPQSWLSLNRVAELSEISVHSDRVVMGAATTWTEMDEVLQERAAELYKVISVFGGPQIRNAGTLGGNIINASPIADSIPFLFVCDALLELTSVSGTRTVNINDFYTEYKKFDLQPGELLSRVTIPTLSEDQVLRLFKVSRRRDLDISTFTAAIWTKTDGQTIVDAGIAYGAVGPVVLRLKKTEAFLRGKPLTLETMSAAGDVAVDEITPLSDVRGSADFRLQLARNVLLKYFHETKMEEVAV